MTGLYVGRIVRFVMSDRSTRSAIVTEIVNEVEGTVNLEVWLRPCEQKTLWVEAAAEAEGPDDLYHFREKTRTWECVPYDAFQQPGTYHLIPIGG